MMEDYAIMPRINVIDLLLLNRLMKEEECQMLLYRKRNRTDLSDNPESKFTALQETELVLKLKKDELFDPHILLPHAELNSIVCQSVNTFVEKYKGKDMTLAIYTDPINPQIQDVFREVYRSHYDDELLKVNCALKRRYARVIILIFVSLITILISRLLSHFNPNETVLSYIILNISGFCLWEIGYTQFSLRNVLDEKNRIIRALNAKIEFQ